MQAIHRNVSEHRKKIMNFNYNNNCNQSIMTAVTTARIPGGSLLFSKFSQK
jgi:hypothetical protein